MAAERARTGDPRMPPQNTEAEEAVLGAMLINPNAIPVVTDLLSRDDFWRESHGIVFDAIRSLYAAGSEVDVVTVSAELERSDKLERVGGREHVHALAEAVPAATAAAHYAEIVREQSALRALIQVGNQIAEMGYTRPDDVPQLLDRAEQQLFQVSQQRRVRDFQPLKAVVDESFDRIMGSKEGVEHEAIKTGFKDVDDLILGLFPSNLIILAARPSQGKTSLALNIAHNVGVEQKTPVAIFSLEMSGLELGDRFLSGAARVSTLKFRNPRLLRQDEMDKLVRASAQLTEAPIFIDDSAGLTMFELRSKARRLHDKHQLGLVIIDYLQLMVGDGRAENRQQEVAGISRSLKQLARELKVPVLAVSQLNRGPEKQTGGQPRKPQLSDLRECLAGDTLVTVSETGERVPIRDLAGERDIPVWTLDEHLRLRSGVMAEAWRTGVRPVFRLRLASGRTIDATANHPLLTVAGWKSVSDLTPDDHVAVARNVPQPAEPYSPLDGDIVLPWERTQRLARSLDDPWLQDLASSDVLWDRVAAIDRAGETDVYDARVPHTHSFLANDVVSHNSGAIEQDADLVMFIHSDPTDETKKGVVELIVSKHRNGPVGLRRLGFVSEYTQFRTLAHTEDPDPF